MPKDTDTISPVPANLFHAITTRKKAVEPRTERQKTFASNLMKPGIHFGIGPAGTGKTYLAVAAMTHRLMNNQIRKIVLCRPAVEAGERIGFLPGDMKEKVDPYMQPLYDALNDFLPAKMMERMIEERQIEIAPLAFMRGRTLSGAGIVLDEAQNATRTQMMMFLTRLGEGSVMAITGDTTQVDLKDRSDSGLAQARDILGEIPGITFDTFTSGDVVRHPLVAKIVAAYEAAV